MKIFELFNNPVKWTTRGTKSQSSSRFVIDGVPYHTSIFNTGDSYRYHESDGGRTYYDNVYSFAFSMIDEDDELVDIITGAGNSIKVFSTVYDILVTTLTEYDIQNLIFTADKSEQSRIQLYDRFVKIFQRQGWKYINEADLSDNIQNVDFADDEIHYFLSRGDSKYTPASEHSPRKAKFQTKMRF